VLPDRAVVVAKVIALPVLEVQVAVAQVVHPQELLEQQILGAVQVVVNLGVLRLLVVLALS
jgi:hypothetical protein